MTPSSCSEPHPEDLRKKFMEAMAAQGGIVRASADGTLSLSLDGFSLSINLDDIQKDYDRTGDLSAYERLVSAIQSRSPPLWASVQQAVYPVFHASSMYPSDVVSEQMTDGFNCSFFCDMDGRKEWISRRRLSEWGIDELTLRKTAVFNLKRYLDAADLVTETDEDGIRIGYFDTDFFYPSSFLIAPGFLRKITDAGFRPPVFVYVPTAGVLEIIQDDDIDQAIGRYGNSILTEYFSDPHPVTDEILEIGDEGIRVLGRFDVSGDQAVFIPRDSDSLPVRPIRSKK